MLIWELAVLLLVVAFLVRWLAPGAGARDAARLDPAHTAELARLREEVDQLTAQVLRLQEEQSFTMRLLAEGGAARTARPLPEGEPDLTTNAEKP
jgi:cell division protein FtsB